MKRYEKMEKKQMMLGKRCVLGWKSPVLGTVMRHRTGYDIIGDDDLDRASCSPLFSEARDSRDAHYIAYMAFGCIALSGILILALACLTGG